ncbi:MAG TPA: hypothetical protein ENJ82_05140 [Bacteroidetes bacterium]|nr:hypothetical protein [Bacteroidota bacterium]
MLNRQQALILLLSILAVGLLVRTYGLTSNGLWQDERTAVLSSQGLFYEKPVESAAGTFTSQIYLDKDTYPNLIQAALWGEGGNTVFYLSVVRVWTKVFGLSDLSLRMMQVLLGLGFIVLMYLFVFRLLGARKWALLAAAIAASHPLLIQYSMELRSYDLAAFLTLLGSYLFVLLYMQPSPAAATRKRYWLLSAYFLVAFLSLMTHYFTLFLYGGHFIYILIYHRNQKDLLTYGLVVTAVFGCFGLWMGPGGGSEGFEVINHRNMRWSEMVELVKDDAENAVIRPASFRYVAGGVSQAMTSLTGLGFQGRGWRIRHFIPLLLLPFLLLGLGLYSKANPIRTRVFLGIMFLLLPFMYVVMAFQAGHTMSFNPTYNMLNVAAVVALLALGGRAIFAMQAGWKRSMFILVLFAHLGIMYFSAHPRNTHYLTGPNPYRIAADQVRENYQTGQIVVWADWYVAQLSNLYLRDRTDIIQKIAEHPSQLVFLEAANGQRQTISRIEDNWHKLPAQ